MFQIDPSLKYVDTNKEEILELYRPTNESLVQIPGLQGEMSDAYLVSLNRSGEIQIYLYFFLKDSGKGIIYKSNVPVTKSNYMQVRDDGLYFLESMGFLMENTDFRKLPEMERIKLMESMPPFHLDLSKFFEKGEKKEEAENDEVDVEVLEENLETIHEISEITEASKEKIEKRKLSGVELSPDMVKEKMDKDRNLRVFLLFLAGF